MNGKKGNRIFDYFIYSGIISGVLAMITSLFPAMDGLVVILTVLAVVLVGIGVILFNILPEHIRR